MTKWNSRYWDTVTAAMKLRDACSLEGKLWPPRQHIKKQRHYFVNKGPSSQGYGFSSGHVWMWELDHKESWVLKSWYFQTLVLENTLESPLDSNEINPVHPKGNQSWIFIGRTDAEAPIFWPPDAKNWLIGKYPDAGKDWRQEEKGTTEDEMVGWHHWLNGHEFESTSGDSEGQGRTAFHGIAKPELSTGTTTTTQHDQITLSNKSACCFSSMESCSAYVYVHRRRARRGLHVGLLLVTSPPFTTHTLGDPRKSWLHLPSSLNLCSCGSLLRGSHTQRWMLAVPFPTGRLPYSLQLEYSLFSFFIFLS